MTQRPDFRFLVDESYFPTRVRIDELVMPVWVVGNFGATGECIYTILWKGEHRDFFRTEIHHRTKVTVGVPEPGIPFEELMLALTGETVTETQIVEFVFRVGFLVNERYIVTDTWNVGVLIEVPEPRILPWRWMLLGLAGVGLVGYIATKK